MLLWFSPAARKATVSNVRCLDLISPNFHYLDLSTMKAFFESLRNTNLIRIGLIASIISLPFSLSDQQPALASGSCNTGNVTPVHSGTYYIDLGDNITGMYVGYKITNNSGANYNDLWVKLDNFTGGKVGLATNEDGIVHIGPLAAGSSKMAYFYLNASGATTSAQSHNVRLFSTRPDLVADSICNHSFSFAAVEATISASANKITSATVSPNPGQLGGEIVVTSTGDAGTVGAAGVFAMTPASLANWPANSYQLVKTEFTVNSGPSTGTYTDTLFRIVDKTTATYSIKYTFLATATTSSNTSLSPINEISSGNPIKHTDTSSWANLRQLGSTNNTTTLTKSVNVSQLTGASRVTYTITLNNSGTVPVTLDDIKDVLPSSPVNATYVAGSAKFNGITIANPTISGQDLTFFNLFTVPANGSSTLTYQADIPSTLGIYTNSAIGHIGSVQIDTTFDTTDNAPATAKVVVDNPANITVNKITTTPNVTAGSTANYTITVSNSAGGNATDVNILGTLSNGFTYASTGTITLNGGANRATTTNPTVGVTTPTWGTFTIPPGGSVAILFTVNVGSGVTSGTYQNSASSTYNNPSGNSATVSYNASASTGEDVTVVARDYSDSPTSGTAPNGIDTNAYGDANHNIVNTLKLGANIDSEATSLASANADGDDINGSPGDEDGVTLPNLTPGATSYSIPAANIKVTNTSGNPATLHAWVDFNKNGTFESSEYTSVTVNTGTNDGNPTTALSWSGITMGAAGNTFARFRLTTDNNVTSATPSGTANDGEVEDYKVAIAGITVVRPQASVLPLTCPINTLSIADLNAGATDNATTITYSNAGGGGRTMTVKKLSGSNTISGPSPNLYPLGTGNPVGGIWLGSDDRVVRSWFGRDTETYEVSFDGDITALNMAFSAINGNTDGIEHIKILNVYNGAGADITSATSYGFVDGTPTGFGSLAFFTDTQTLEPTTYSASLTAGGTYGNSNGTITLQNTVGMRRVVFQRLEPGNSSSTNTISPERSNGVGMGPVSYCSLATNIQISGTVFEDPNYGGGVGRPLNTPATSGRANARVEIYDSTGAFKGFTTTDSAGLYKFDDTNVTGGIQAGNYKIRVVNSTVTSSRLGYVSTLIPVQTFRTDAFTGTVINVTDHVGGEKPAEIDASSNTANANLATLDTPTEEAQSLTVVQVNSTNVTGIDFGYNFDTIVNTNDAGQGSLRQFVTNSNALKNTNLAQEGQTAGKEVSIFMISDGAARAGLSGGYSSGINGTGGNIGAAVISLANNFSITDSDTHLDATTQTTNVSDLNSGTIGTGGIVGVDGLNLSTIPKPEVVLDLRSVPANTNAILVNGGNTLLKGFAIYGYRTTGNLATLLKGAIVINDVVPNSSPATITQLLGGTMADGSDPGVPTIDVGYTLQTAGAANIFNNYLAYNSDAITFENTNGTSVDFIDNEVAYNGPKNNNGSNASGIYADQIETVEGTKNITIKRNLIRDSSKPGYASAQGQGIQISYSSFIMIENNTFTNNNVYAINASSSDTTIQKNIIRGTKNTGLGQGSGIAVYYGGPLNTGVRNRISQNSIYQNAKLGIDHQIDGVTPNDGLISATQPNNGIDYPVITASTLNAGKLKVKGYVGSSSIGNPIFGNATVELFVADDDGNNNGEVILNDTRSTSHGEGKTYIGSCTTDANGLFGVNSACEFTNATTMSLSSAKNITSTATDSQGNTSEFSSVALNNPNVLLVKRITNINGSTSTLNGQDLASYIDEPSNPYDDNTLSAPAISPPDTDQWPNLATFLVGGTDGGNVRPGDIIEYTIYFLSNGDGVANNVSICDLIPGKQTFVPSIAMWPGTVPILTSAAGGSGGDRGIMAQANEQIKSYTNLSDGDNAHYYPPGTVLPNACRRSPTAQIPTNTNGAVVVDLGTIVNPINATLTDKPYGFMRFRTRVD